MVNYILAGMLSCAFQDGQKGNAMLVGVVGQIEAENICGGFHYIGKAYEFIALSAGFSDFGRVIDERGPVSAVPDVGLGAAKITAGEMALLFELGSIGRGCKQNEDTQVLRSRGISYPSTAPRSFVVAAHLVFGEVGPSGTRLVSEFIRLLDLEPFVGTSHGCQYDVRVRIEEGLVHFGKEERVRLASTMQPREITVCQDEIIHPQSWLVAMEPGRLGAAS